MGNGRLEAFGDGVIIIMVVAAVLACSPVLAEPINPKLLDAKNIQPSGLTPDQARQVLAVAVKHEGFKISRPDMWFEGPWQVEGKPFHPGYYDFGLLSPINVQGHYAVNPLTGDVWQTELCKRFSFATLSKIQKRISEKTGKKLVGEDVASDAIGC